MNLKNMKRIHGKEEFDFFPQTFLVPNDWKVFKATYFETTCKKWIIKPVSQIQKNSSLRSISYLVLYLIYLIAVSTTFNKWDAIFSMEYGKHNLDFIHLF